MIENIEIYYRITLRYSKNKNKKKNLNIRNFEVMRIIKIYLKIYSCFFKNEKYNNRKVVVVKLKDEQEIKLLSKIFQ